MYLTPILTFLLSFEMNEYFKFKTVSESNLCFSKSIRETQNWNINISSKLGILPSARRERNDHGGGLTGASGRGCQGERLREGGEWGGPLGVCLLWGLFWVWDGLEAPG